MDAVDDVREGAPGNPQKRRRPSLFQVLVLPTRPSILAMWASYRAWKKSVHQSPLPVGIGALLEAEAHALGPNLVPPPLRASRQRRDADLIDRHPPSAAAW